MTTVSIPWCSDKCFQNALAYFVTDVSYARKMLMKSTPGVSVIKLITAVIYKFLQ
jgi:hypothetical protein